MNEPPQPPQILVPTEEFVNKVGWVRAPVKNQNYEKLKFGAHLRDEIWEEVLGHHVKDIEVGKWQFHF